MADQGMWFKLWCTALADAELENLSPHEWYCWARLGTYIKAHGNTGTAKFTAPAYALTSLFHVPTFGAALALMKRFPHCILEEGKAGVSSETSATVSVKVTFLNWLKYQGDFSTGRVRKFRSKNRKMKHVEERRGEVEEKRREESPQTPTSSPSATPPTPGNGAAKSTAEDYPDLPPAKALMRTLKINGKLVEPDPEIPDSERMSPEEMEAIRQRNMDRARDEADVF